MQTHEIKLHVVLCVGCRVVVGVGYVNLHDLVPRDSPPATSIAETWVPVSIVNSLADPKWVVCSAGKSP